MGVVNVTPDSFSDGGRFLEPRGGDRAWRCAWSTRARPSSMSAANPPVPAPQPVSAWRKSCAGSCRWSSALRERTAAVISVDTSKPEVMRAAAAAGAGLINDVRALREPGALEAAARSGLRGVPDAHAGRAAHHAAGAQLRRCRERGQGVPAASACRLAAPRASPPSGIAIDPGFGFGKTLEHNLALLRGLAELARADVPLLVGPVAQVDARQTDRPRGAASGSTAASRSP